MTIERFIEKAQLRMDFEQIGVSYSNNKWYLSLTPFVNLTKNVDDSHIDNKYLPTFLREAYSNLLHRTTESKTSIYIVINGLEILYDKNISEYRKMEILYREQGNYSDPRKTFYTTESIMDKIRELDMVDEFVQNGGFKTLENYKGCVLQHRPNDENYYYVVTTE